MAVHMPWPTSSLCALHLPSSAPSENNAASTVPVPASQNPDGEWIVAHFSSSAIDLLLTRLMACKDKALQVFFDGFFGSSLTTDPDEECWLKVRIPAADKQPSEVARPLLSFKRNGSKPASDTSGLPFALLTDPEEVKDIVAAKLELARENVFEQLMPFLALYVHRVSVKSSSGNMELWVDSACRTTFKKKTTLAQALRDPSLLGAAMPSGKHEWFVSAGCRFHRGTFASGPNTIPFVDEVLAMFGLEREVQSLVWAPSKAFHFRGLADDQVQHLHESNFGGFDYRDLELAHERHLDPLDNSGLILWRGAPDRAAWLKAWSAVFFKEDVEDTMRTSLLEKGLDAVDSLLPPGSPSDGPAWAEAIYSVPARAFGEIRVGKHMVGAVLYQMLHLWEAQFPLTREQLQETVDILSHDPTESLASATVSRLNRSQLWQVLTSETFRVLPLATRLPCVEELRVHDMIMGGFNQFQTKFKWPTTFYCISF